MLFFLTFYLLICIGEKFNVSKKKTPIYIESLISYHPGGIYFIKNTEKNVLLWNIFDIFNIGVLF